ncbi:dihydroorotate dehydrogenase electron transfer subunit [Balnearium lithotrophicum]|uniref:Dihydroorotate dehydrogenase electron transfer subunit n=1 Tax=Balnearium lithotrophicum TaxID=223788 RepID=A0A521CNG6_9BACT|nr:dihydroorotate dehydrogenase electron transfer subunit [Balnearium lithotrophicum]SMO60986.1 dihydroorotate dehydrogenase electron transfer subunit [Balnearium lithotrophicum]
MEVLENRHVTGRDYILTVRVPLGTIERIKPGQFGMVQVRSSLQFDPLLRRPLGIFNVEGDRVSFLYRVYGRGTELLTKVSPGEEVEILMPLGNSIPENYDRYLFIAGGIGIGGLFLASRWFKERGKEVVFVYGERSSENLSGIEFLRKYGINSVVYTEDGSFGKKGLVTSELQSYEDFVWIACGPTPMMKAVKELAKELNVECYLSLDRRMACGVGACLGCTVKTVNGYKRCCVEGPVFKADEVIFD